MQYRKKPVVIEACQWDPHNSQAFLEWLGALPDQARLHEIEFHGGPIAINTLEGWMRAEPGDYIICGIKNELYPCKPDIFEASYERV